MHLQPNSCTSLLLAGDCLLDAPAKALSLPAELPGRGALYSLDQQCQQIFGKDFQHCPNTTEEDICAQLWCRMGTGEPLCHTKNGSLPWADGTPCKGGGLCWDGACLPQDALQPQVPAQLGGTWGCRAGTWISGVPKSPSHSLWDHIGVCWVYILDISSDSTVLFANLC